MGCMMNFYTGTVEFKGQTIEVEAQYIYDPAEYLDGFKVCGEGVELDILNTCPDLAELSKEDEDELYEIVAEAALEDYHARERERDYHEYEEDWR